MGPSRRSRIAHAQEFMTPISKLVLVAATPSRFGTTSKWSSAVRGSSAHLADCFCPWVRGRFYWLTSLRDCTTCSKFSGVDAQILESAVIDGRPGGPIT